MSALTDLFTAFANKIRSKTGGSDTYTPPQMVNAIDDVYQAGVDAGTTPTQTKTVTAGTTTTTVTPDTGYALSSVTVNPTPSQSKSATPSTTAQTITPDSGKLLSSVSVSAIQTQTKSATPSTSAQTITPDSGKYLTSVSVGAISTETKSQAAGTSNIDVTPTSGKYLTKVTITPQQHSGYYPSSSTNITSNGTSDLGASHNYRYVKVSVPNPTLSGNATTSQVLASATFYSNSYTKQTGTISSKASATYNTSTSDQTISSGQYLSGTQTIKAVTTSNITAANIKDGTTITVGDANSATRIKNVTGTFTDASTVSSGQTAAAAAQIRSGYSAWVDGAEVKGSIANQAAATYNTSTSDQTIASGKYISGTQTIKAVTTSGISATNIKDGTTIKVGDANSATRIANVTGTFTDASTVSSGQTAAGAAQIKSGYSAWVDGAEVKGSYTEPTITDIDPSDLSPVSLATTGNYHPTSAGYAIASNLTALAPSNSNPAPIYYGNIYKATDDGYAIGVYQEKTPSASGVAFSAGMVKMSSAGYAYSAEPTPRFTPTTLWTNSSPTSTFAAQTINLSQAVSNFDYIELEYRYTKSDATTATIMLSKEDMLRGVLGTYPLVARSLYYKASSSATSMARSFMIATSAGTSVYFTSAFPLDASSGGNNNNLIPTKITGLKFSLS